MYLSRNLHLLLVLGLLGISAPALALKTDRQQPIRIRADHGDFKSNAGNQNGTGVYTGHVIIIQGSIRITAHKAILHMVNGEVSTADMTGDPAAFQQQPDTGLLVHGTAQEITYNESSNEVDLLHHAQLRQGQRLFNANVIHYNISDEHVVASGGKRGGRVHVTIPPKATTKGNPPS